MLLGFGKPQQGLLQCQHGLPSKAKHIAGVIHIMPSGSPCLFCVPKHSQSQHSPPFLLHSGFASGLLAGFENTT